MPLIVEEQSKTATSLSLSPSTTSPTTVVNVNIINDSKINQFDVLELSRSTYTRLFPEIPEKELSYPVHYPSESYLLVKFIGVPDYFKTFRIVKIQSVTARTTETITFVNDSNLVTFDKDELTFNKSIIKRVDPINIPILSQVFISVPDNIYHLLHGKSQNAIKELFFTQFLSTSGNVVNEGDNVRQINGRASLCEPVSQGRLDFDTNIILIKQDKEVTSTANTYLLDSLEESDEIDKIDESDKIDEFDEIEEIDAMEEAEVDEDVDLSTYLSRSMAFDNATTTPKSTTLFSIKPLPEKIKMEDLPQKWQKDDSELFAYINSSDFTKLKFPVFNGDLVKLKTENSGSKSTVIIRLFGLLEPQTSFEKGCVYVSPLLLLNLTSVNNKVEFESINEQSFTDLVPIAESATISRVSSEITMDKTYQQSFFSSLKSLLSSQRKCFREGDVFPVYVDTVLAKAIFDSTTIATIATSATATEGGGGDKEGNENSSNDVIPMGNPNAVAWFKVTEIKGPNQIETLQYLIDPAKTLLVSSGLESITLPRNEEINWNRYLELPSIFNYNLTDDFKYAKEFRKILLTCISSRLNLKTSILLNSMSRGIGKTTLVRSTCLDLGLNLVELDCFDFLNPGQELKTIGQISGKIENLIGPDSTKNSQAFYVIYLKHIENLCPKIDENDQNSSIHSSLTLKVVQMLSEFLNTHKNAVIVMSCNDYDKLDENLKSLIKFTIDFTVPTETERLEIFRHLIGKEKLKQPLTELSSYPFVLRKDVSYSTLALQSAGLTPRDLISIIKKSKKLAIKRLNKLAKELGINVKTLVEIGYGGTIKWIPEDFEAAINDARSQFSDSIGAPRIPNVKWEDIGGLDLVKDEILDTIDMPLKHPDLFNNGLKKRSGILFYGPPGTGKTLLAKAIATNFSLNFFSVKGPELLNMYIGESEANVRRVFQRARDAKPCVIFFDELDSVAPKRGNQGDSGGVMDRIVSQLLAELDGMSSAGGDGVFVVGATNRPDLLDEALLRPGRFDKMLYLGISDTNEKQTKIMEALTRKFQLDDDVDLEKIAEKCSFTYTGADFYALCSDSMLNAMTRVANEVDAKIKAYNEEEVVKGNGEVNSRWWFDNVATKEDIRVAVKMEDFIKAQNELTPSVSAEELQHYLKVRENFEGGKENAKKEQGLQPLHEEQPPQRLLDQQTLESILSGETPNVNGFISQNSTKAELPVANGDINGEHLENDTENISENNNGNLNRFVNGHVNDHTS